MYHFEFYSHAFPQLSQDKSHISQSQSVRDYFRNVTKYARHVRSKSVVVRGHSHRNSAIKEKVKFHMGDCATLLPIYKKHAGPQTVQPARVTIGGGPMSTDGSRHAGLRQSMDKVSVYLGISIVNMLSVELTTQ